MLTSALVVGLLTVVSHNPVTPASETHAAVRDVVVVSAIETGCADVSGSWLPGTLRTGNASEQAGPRLQDKHDCALV